MNYIDFVVRNKHIESRQNAIIADNTDYVFRFTFLGKWTEFETKTVLMLREDGKFYRCDMKDGATSLMLPKFTSPLTLLIGVTAGSGEDEISTDRLLFNVRSSIRTGANEELEKPESGAEDFLAEYCRRYDELLLKLEALDNVYILPSVTSADAGKVLRVSAAGEWEAADGDGDSKPFVVTVTYGDNDTLTADKTHAEIVEAYAAGAQINAKIVNYPGVIVPSILPLYVNNADLVFIFSGSGVLDGSAMAMTAQDFNGSWSVSLTELATLGDIPSGGTDTSLGVTGATVGQTVKIKAVDENGIPTEWEAADAASGEIPSAVTPTIGDNGNWYLGTTDTGKPSRGEKGDKGDKGDKGVTGADGTSVTVSSVSESTADGGENIVTFSDGKTLTVKNGSKGSKGEKGEKGDPTDVSQTTGDNATSVMSQIAVTDAITAAIAFHNYSEDELSGTWVFNDTLNSPYPDVSVNFIASNIKQFNNMKPGLNGTTIYYGFLDDNGDQDGLLAYSASGWMNTAYKTIEITSKLSEVTNGETFLTWLKANATKQSDVQQTTGQSTTAVMSQKAVTDAISKAITTTLNTEV